MLRGVCFSGRSVFAIDPRLLLFGTRGKAFTGDSRHVTSLFAGLLRGLHVGRFSIRLGFVRHRFLAALREGVGMSSSFRSGRSPCLPSLSSTFHRSFGFLSAQPGCLLGRVRRFLSFCTFACATRLDLTVSS